MSFWKVIGFTHIIFYLLKMRWKNINADYGPTLAKQLLISSRGWSSKQLYAVVYIPMIRIPMSKEWCDLQLLESSIIFCTSEIRWLVCLFRTRPQQWMFGYLYDKTFFWASLTAIDPSTIWYKIYRYMRRTNQFLLNLRNFYCYFCLPDMVSEKGVWQTWFKWSKPLLEVYE